MSPDTRLIGTQRPRLALRAPANCVAVTPAARREGRATRLEPLADFAQLQLHFVDHVQWRYEVIRPLVLFDDRTAAQRAVETHTHPETVRRLTRRFRHQGTLGLFPNHTELISPRRGQQVSDQVVEELARLKARYDGFQFRELVRIIQYKCNERLDDKTIKKLWQQSPGPVQGELPLETYHRHPQRY